MLSAIPRAARHHPSLLLVSRSPASDTSMRARNRSEGTRTSSGHISGTSRTSWCCWRVGEGWWTLPTTMGCCIAPLPSKRGAEAEAEGASALQDWWPSTQGMHRVGLLWSARFRFLRCAELCRAKAILGTTSVCRSKTHAYRHLRCAFTPPSVYRGRSTSLSRFVMSLLGQMFHVCLVPHLGGVAHSLYVPLSLLHRRADALSHAYYHAVSAPLFQERCSDRRKPS